MADVVFGVELNLGRNVSSTSTGKPVTLVIREVQRTKSRIAFSEVDGVRHPHVTPPVCRNTKAESTVTVWSQVGVDRTVDGYKVS